nr:unnamed protein product [Callosobruchus chinensis]
MDFITHPDAEIKKVSTFHSVLNEATEISSNSTKITTRDRDGSESLPKAKLHKQIEEQRLDFCQLIVSFIRAGKEAGCAREQKRVNKITDAVMRI